MRQWDYLYYKRSNQVFHHRTCYLCWCWDQWRLLWYIEGFQVEARFNIWEFFLGFFLTLGKMILEAQSSAEDVCFYLRQNSMRIYQSVPKSEFDELVSLFIEISWRMNLTWFDFWCDFYRQKSEILSTRVRKLVAIPVLPGNFGYKIPFMALNQSKGPTFI